MVDLIIKHEEEDYYLPEVNFLADEGKLELLGESYPEDAKKFYEAVIKWLREYLETTQNPVVFEMKLTYFNTTSSKSLLEIFHLLREQQEKGKEVTVNWYSNGSDPDIEEEVEDFEIDSGVKINLIMVS